MNEKYPRTYSELIDRIVDDLRLRLKGSTFSQIQEALHLGQTQALIAEFVGYRHIELKERERKEKKKKEIMVNMFPQRSINHTRKEQPE